MIPQKPLKILMTADTVGGVWTYCLNLVKALKKYHVEVALATMGAPLNAAQRKDIASIDNTWVLEGNYKLEWMDQPWNDIAAAGEWLMQIAGDLQPDIVHLNGYAHSALPFDAPRVVVAHSCVNTWWQAVHEKSAPVAWKEYTQKVCNGLNCADVVVAPTKAMMQALVHQYPFKTGRKVIYNGLDGAGFRQESKKQVVFCMGRLWDEAKNIRVMEKAATDIVWPVYVAGDHTHPSGGNGVKVQYLNMLGKMTPAQVKYWLSIAPVYALPARYEPFGLSVLEAALSGCALVLGDIPTLRELWQDAALFVEPNDTDEWKKAINRLIRNERLRERLARKAGERAKKYTIESTAKQYMDLYCSLLNRSIGTVAINQPKSMEAQRI